MLKKILSLSDGSGGLNDTAPPSAIAQNEFSRLSNWITDEGGWPGKKRLGKDSWQRGPIDVNEFTSDADDTLLLHLDEADASSTFVDDSSASNDFVPAMANNIRGVGILPTAGPLAQQFVAGYNTGYIYRVVDSTEQLSLDGKDACTFDAEIKIGTDFSGAPIVVPPIYGVSVPAYQTGVPIIATYLGSSYETDQPLLFQDDLRTGLTLHRDYDSATGTDVGAPYAKFTLYTAGGVVTTVRTGGLATSTWLQIRGRYDGDTGLVQIFVDGSLHDTAVLGGGVLIDNSQGFAAAIGGTAWMGLKDADLFLAGFGAADAVAQLWVLAQNAAQTAAVTHVGVPGAATAYNNLATACSDVANFLYFVRQAFLDASNNRTLPWALGPELQILNDYAADAQTSAATAAARYATALAIVADPATTAAYLPAVAGLADVPAIPYYSSVASVMVDEVRVGTVARTTFPFKRPRGKPWPLSKADGTRQLIFAAGDSLYMTVGDGGRTKLNIAANDTMGDEAFSTTASWEGSQFGDVLYLSNGVDSPKSWDGIKLRPWGEGKSVLTLTGTNVGGGSGIGAGDHNYYYTFVYGSKETGPSVLTMINYASDAFDTNLAAIPTNRAGCTARKIYRKKNSNGLLYLIRTIADNTTTTMTGSYTAGGVPGPTTDTGRDGVVETDLGTGAYTEMPAAVLFTAMDKPRFLAGLHNRIFRCGMLNNPYTLAYCEDGVPEVNPAANFVNAEQDQGVLLGLAPYYTEMHVTKGGNGTLVLRGDKPSNWRVLQTLHPTIGAIDHWSFVHRTIPKRDSYILCFWAKDGAYGYAGQDFFKLSDKVEKTVAGLVQGNATRIDSIVTTQAEWTAAISEDGSATANIYTPSYYTDGLREVPGDLRIADQLGYLGLNMPSGATGKPISICKGPAEGEFFFGVDSQNVLFRTTDNFVTAAAVGATPLGAGERIIEIIRRGTDQFYFCICDSANGSSSNGGKIYAWNQSGAAWSTIYNTALYYDLDVPMFMNGGVTIPSVSVGGFGGRAIGQGNSASSPNNIYINHAQVVTLTRTQNTFPAFNGETITQFFGGGTSLQGVCPTGLFSQTQSGTFSISPQIAVTPGYCYANCSKTNVLNAIPFDVQLLTVTYTRREFPRWLGGTYGPQAYWDATNSRLVFLASTAEDANGNRSSYLRTLTSGGTLVNQYTAANVSAFTPYGPSLAMYTVQASSTGAYGFAGLGRRSTLLSPGTIISSGALQANLLANRLSYNAANTPGVLAAFKNLSGGAQDFSTYSSSLRFMLFTTLAPGTSLKTLAADGDAGAVFTEFSVQTTTPRAWYAAVDRLSVAEPGAVYTIASAAAAAGDVTVYKTGFREATGLRSNLLFVPASGAGENYNWADRLYFSAAGAVNQVVQLGIPGTWRVVGVYESSAFVTGGIDAFGDFQSSYAGAVGFEMRNGPGASLGSVLYAAVTANAQIVAFSPSVTNNAFQWRVTLTWDNTIGSPNPGVSPKVDVVDVAYFQGSPNIPRIVAFHYANRTYWALAEAGQTYNNLVMVLQKNDNWTRYDNWRLDGMNVFRGAFVAIEDYSLIKIESGRMDLGSLITASARTGYILNDLADKCLRDVHVNVASFVNQDQPARSGWMKIQPYGADRPLDAEWFFELPAAATPEPRQVRGQFEGDFPYAYARSFALEVSTSDDEGGDFEAPPKQVEEIAGALITLMVSNSRTLETVP